jgi:hypothetical protein
MTAIDGKRAALKSGGADLKCTAMSAMNPLLGAKRTQRRHRILSAGDPSQTLQMQCVRMFFAQSSARHLLLAFGITNKEAPKVPPEASGCRPALLPDPAWHRGGGSTLLAYSG